MNEEPKTLYELISWRANLRFCAYWAEINGLNEDLHAFLSMIFDVTEQINAIKREMTTQNTGQYESNRPNQPDA